MTFTEAYYSFNERPPVIISLRGGVIEDVCYPNQDQDFILIDHDANEAGEVDAVITGICPVIPEHFDDELMPQLMEFMAECDEPDDESDYDRIGAESSIFADSTETD